jgi:hypothetical protein
MPEQKRVTKGSLASVRPIAVGVLLPLLGCRVATAERCLISGPRYNLTADVVTWSMKVESGRPLHPLGSIWKR